jgi:hypothetical protein
MSGSEVIERDADGVACGGDAYVRSEGAESATDAAEPEAFSTEEELASVREPRTVEHAESLVEPAPPKPKAQLPGVRRPGSPLPLSPDVPQIQARIADALDRVDDATIAEAAPRAGRELLVQLRAGGFAALSDVLSVSVFVDGRLGTNADGRAGPRSRRSMWSEREVVSPIAITLEDEAVSSHGGTVGAGILDNEGGGAKRGGRFGAFLVPQLRMDGGDSEDRHADGGVEASESGSGPELFDGELGSTVNHPRASAFFFGAERVFVGVAGWNTSK